MAQIRDEATWPEPTWQCPGVRLYLGDCLEVLPTFPDASVPMIWTDPPFGHGNMQDDLQAARVRDGVLGARRADVQPIANDTGEGFERILTGFLDEATRLLTPDCCCCCCCGGGGGGPQPTFARVAKWIDERLEFFHAVVWDKSARGNGMGWRYRRNYEFVMVAHRRGGTLLWQEGAPAIPNVLRDMPVADRQHPNEKPLALVKRFLGVHGNGGGLVLDPFMGSGTTGVACVQLGREFVGIEIEPKYFDIAVTRIDQERRQGRLEFGP